MSPCLFNLHAEYIMWNTRLDEAQAGIKTARRNINNLRYTDDITLIAESEQELKSLLMKVKEESEKADLKTPHHGIRSHPFIANRWGNNGTETDFIFLGSKIIADGDCNHEIKRHLLLGRKAMKNLDNILKSRDVTLLIKVRLVKAMVFPVVMYRYESWTIKKAEHQRCFWTVVLEKTLESPLERKDIKPVNPKGNQPWICIGRTDAEAQMHWPPDAKNWLTGKDPGAGKDWRQEEKQTTEDEMVGWHHRLNGCEFQQTLGDDEGQRSPACCKESDMTEQLNNNDTTQPFYF